MFKKFSVGLSKGCDCVLNGIAKNFVWLPISVLCSPRKLAACLLKISTATAREFPDEKPCLGTLPWAVSLSNTP